MSDETMSQVSDSVTVTATLNMTNYSECSLPAERGSCSESLTRYHYVPELEKCIPFVFSGCKVIRCNAAGCWSIMSNVRQGNPNNFHSRKECFGACHPQEEDFHLSGSGEGENNEEASEDDLNKLKLPLWLPFPIAPASSPDSVCDLVQVFSH